MKQPAFYGVNLGGWLVLEKWMTPSLFRGTDATDEYTFMQTPDARGRIENHRRTFITEADFAWLADHGVTMLRIPVGYWLFESTGPFTPTIAYLDWAIKMAKKYDLKVLVDLHGAPGSQNGRDHSGRAGKSLWYRKKAYREETVETIARIAAYYKDEPTVWGLELLNEPKIGLFQFKLRRFYKQAYKAIIRFGRPGIVTVFSDAFTPRLLSGALRPQKDYPVVMDIHWYHFTDWLFKWRPIENYFRKLVGKKKLLNKLRRRQPIVIGEWSVVLAHEAMRTVPADEEKVYVRRHGSLQVDTYREAEGWFYWTYKTERPGIWHFRSQVEDGTIALPDRSTRGSG